MRVEMNEPIRPGFTRVSTILQAFSGLEEVNSEILQIACQRGEIVHWACECLVKNLGIFSLEENVEAYCRNREHTLKELEKVNGCIASFQRWRDSVKPKNIQFVKRLYNQDYMITGEIDMLYEGSNGLTLLDIKTSCSESPSWLLQGSCYSFMLKEHGYDIRNIEFLRLSRTGGKAKSYFYEENFPLFKAHLDAYNYSFRKRQSFENLDFL